MRISLPTPLAPRRLTLGLLVPLLVLSAVACKGGGKQTDEPGAPQTLILRPYRLPMRAAP